MPLAIFSYYALQCSVLKPLKGFQNNLKLSTSELSYILHLPPFYNTYFALFSVIQCMLLHAQILLFFLPFCQKFELARCAAAIYRIHSGTFCCCASAPVGDHIYGVEYFAQSCQICLLLPNESCSRWVIYRETYIFH